MLARVPPASAIQARGSLQFILPLDTETHVNNHTQVHFASAKARSQPAGARGSLGRSDTLAGIMAGHMSGSE